MLPFLVPPLVVVAGGLTVYGLMRRHGWAVASSAAWALAAAPGVGFGLLSAVFFFWVFAGMPPPGRLTLTALTGVLALALIAPVYQRPGGPQGPLGREHLGWRSLWQGTVGSRVALVAVLAIAAVAFGLLLWTFPQVTKTQPYGGWDAKAIWNVRALFLYRADGDLGEIFPRLKHGHPDYPLLLPASLAGQYCLAGGEHLAIPAFTSLLFTLGASAALFLAAARFASPAVACAAVAVYLVTPAVWRWAAAQYADIPLSYFLLMAVLTLSSQLDRDRGGRLPPVLAGLFLSFLAWTKNEGTVQAGLLAAAFAVLYAGARRPAAERWRRPLWIAAGALPVAVALTLFKVFWSPVNETARFLGGGLEKFLTLERWLTIVSAYWRQLVPMSGAARWGLLWAALALCALAFRRHRAAGGRPLRLFDATLVLCMGLSVMAYVMTPDGVQWHLSTSLTRLLLQLTPLAMVWAVAGAGRGRPEGARTEQDAEDSKAQRSPA